MTNCKQNKESKIKNFKKHFCVEISPLLKMWVRSLMMSTISHVLWICPKTSTKDHDLLDFPRFSFYLIRELRMSWINIDMLMTLNTSDGASSIRMFTIIAYFCKDPLMIHVVAVNDFVIQLTDLICQSNGSKHHFYSAPSDHMQFSFS